MKKHNEDARAEGALRSRPCPPGTRGNTPHPDLSAGSPPEDSFPPALARGLEWSPRKASSITLSGLLSMACRRQAGFGRTKLSSESGTARTGGA